MKDRLISFKKYPFDSIAFEDVFCSSRGRHKDTGLLDGAIW
jgi:hypothetical protein